MRKEAMRELAEHIHFGDAFDAKAFDNVTGPCVSIYLPIHHTERERRRDEWDRIEFKDLAKQAEKQLAEQYDDSRSYQGIKDFMNYILENEDLPLWLDAKEALGFLITNERADVFNMDVKVSPLSIVDDHPHVIPLVQNEEKMDLVYKLLLLNADYFAILDGNAEKVIYEKIPAAVKHYFAETYPEFDGDTAPLDYYSLQDHESPYHHYKSRNDVKQEEAEKFFRYVNEAVHKMCDGDPTPIILVTLPEHEHAFRTISTIRTLLPKGIDKDPQSLTGKQLRTMAMEIMDAQ